MQITNYLRRIIKRASVIANRHFAVRNKVGDDLVTDADLEIEKYLIDKLQHKFPNFDIISEEFNAEKSLTENCFVIDPIDGTINFANGLPLWGMQIACVMGGTVVSAVLYFPVLRQIYWADGGGSFCNGKRLNIDKNNWNKKPIYVVEGGNKFDALADMEKNVSRNFRYLCCASLNYAWTAAGILGGNILRKDTVWDYMPGLFLVQTAGGFVIDEPSAHIGAVTKQMAQDLYRHARAKNI
jgi:myo-inositol-1(or 4)-monophosphatase